MDYQELAKALLKEFAAMATPQATKSSGGDGWVDAPDRQKAQWVFADRSHGSLHWRILSDDGGRVSSIDMPMSLKGTVTGITAHVHTPEDPKYKPSAKLRIWVQASCGQFCVQSGIDSVAGRNLIAGLHAALQSGALAHPLTITPVPSDTDDKVLFMNLADSSGNSLQTSYMKGSEPEHFKKLFVEVDARLRATHGAPPDPNKVKVAGPTQAPATPNPQGDPDDIPF